MRTEGRALKKRHTNYVMGEAVCGLSEMDGELP